MHEIKAPETILISQLQWDALMERLEELEDSLITLQAELDIATGKSQVVTIHDADEFCREMVTAKPLRTADFGYADILLVQLGRNN